MTKVEQRIFLVEIVEVVACTMKVVKIKEHLGFIEDSTYFALEIELLLTVLSNFEREVAL